VFEKKQVNFILEKMLLSSSLWKRKGKGKKNERKKWKEFALVSE
jgi:hypothetical protein